LTDWILQAAKALGYYVALLALVRMAGKRLAGQTASLDLIVLVTLSVVLQKPLLDDGDGDAIVFLLVVFAAHLAQTWLSRKSRRLRWLVRGKPRPLIRDGVVDEEALTQEAFSRDDLLAGLRKVGHERPEDVKLAVLEENGQVSAVAKD
jgi:uncharacterized membrane protein YcaP (DUF421 family)